MPTTEQPKPTDHCLPPGTKVRYDDLDQGGPECVIVVPCWFDAEIDGNDCYVAFFGGSHRVPAPPKYLTS